MKAKVLLGLAVCCFLFSLGLLAGLAIKGVQAQSTPGPWLQQPLFVKFAEDFMRQHGRQVKSYCVHCADPDTFYLVDTVPSDKRFIVTDIGVFSRVWLSADPGGTPIRAAFWGGDLVGQGPFQVGLHTGIVFEPNESIYVAKMADSCETHLVTISGYFVDNP